MYSKSGVKGYKIVLRCDFTTDASQCELTYLPKLTLSFSSPHRVFPPLLFVGSHTQVKTQQAVQGSHPASYWLSFQPGK